MDTQLRTHDHAKIAKNEERKEKVEKINNLQGKMSIIYLWTNKQITILANDRNEIRVQPIEME